MENPKRKKALRALAITLCALALVGGGLLIRVQMLKEDPLSAFETPTPLAVPTLRPTRDPARTPVITFTPTPTPTLPPERVLGASTINIVLMGLDSDTEREEKEQGWRSDTIAILVVDTEKPACTVINVPRDTRARVRKMNSAGKVIGTQYSKINASFQFGGGPEAYGHENLLYSLEQLLFDGLQSDVAFHFYASLDMDGIGAFADAVDGVTVTLAYDVPGFGKEGEAITLRGDAARAFVRLRHGITGGSDIGRITRQQAFIRAFAQRVKDLGARETVPLLWSAMSSDLHTNLTLEQMLVLADILMKLDLDTAEFLTLPGNCKTIDGRSYYVPDTKKIKSLARTLWGNGDDDTKT